MSKHPVEYLRHINDECVFIKSVIDDRISLDDFLADELLKRAVSRSLEIIGEASKKIPADFKLKWYQISWKQMAGLRDRLIHEYMGVNYLIVWDVVKNKIPELHLQIKEAIQTQ